jgi:hypothetical protein
MQIFLYSSVKYGKAKSIAVARQASNAGSIAQIDPCRVGSAHFTKRFSLDALLQLICLATA